MEGSWISVFSSGNLNKNAYNVDALTEAYKAAFGGYAFYPGYYDQTQEKNPYGTEIEEVGIGAFSLVPTKDSSGSIWLSNFLKEKLQRKPVEYRKTITDSYYVEEAPRIPYHGTEVTRFNDLVIIANQLGPDRDADYIEQFKRLQGLT